ncbi:MAG: MCE family protein [Planctomycetes bacterium]|nr:MCE family protein [Planctomycetota bacterium]
MKHPVRDFVIGATTIAGLAGLFVLLWLVGELSWFRAPTYDLRLRMDNAGGMLPSAPITLNGVRIGNVRSIKTADDPRQGVLMTLAVDESVRVPKEVSVAILRDFVGASTLSLTSKFGETPENAGFFAPGDEFQSKAYAPGLTGELSSLLDKRLATLDTAVAKFNTLADTYTEVGQRVKTMLEPRTLRDVEAGKSEANVTTAVERFDRAVADARGWLGDAQIKSDTKAAVQKLSQTLDRAAELADEWKKTAQSVTASATDATAQFSKTAGDLGEASRRLSDLIHEVQTVVAKVTTGEGTAGQLLTNPDLFRNLNDAAQRLEQTLTEAKLLIEKYRKEGVPIQF